MEANTRDTAMTPRLEELRRDIALQLIQIDDLLPAEYAITLVARHMENDDAHIIVTRDPSLSSVVSAIEQLTSAQPQEREGQ